MIPQDIIDNLEKMNNEELQNIVDNLDELRDALDYYGGQYNSPIVNEYMNQYLIQSNTIRNFLMNMITKEQ